MHSAKITSFFAINHDDNHKFSLKLSRATECKYAGERVLHTFMGVCVCVKIESSIVYSQIHKFLNLVDDA